MILSPLMAISPIDGRYGNKTDSLQQYFSEYALIYNRVLVEIRWFQFLANSADILELPTLNTATNDFLDNIIKQFSIEDAEIVKSFERKTNHDVKAVEYFIKRKFNESKNEQLIAKVEFVHFACTSEDINNLAYGLILQGARSNVLLPMQKSLITALKDHAIQYRDAAMLSKTHGQVASPTTMGKEFANVVQRLQRQIQQVESVPILGKINGAVGNYNAHISAYPNVNWQLLSKSFVESLGIDWNAYTTQIEPHDYIAELFDALARFNTVVLDFNKDIWAYISVGYFKQKKIEGETGSSTMPHKVNPIDFENSEGNLGLANAIMNHLSSKLPISRWQRDLTDSTVLRNLGTGLAYSLIAYQSTLKGLTKLEINVDKLSTELNDSWEVLAEPIQTIMRKYDVEAAYEKLKSLSRGQTLKQADIVRFVADLDIPEAAKQSILDMTPANYIGAAIALVDQLAEY